MKSLLLSLLVATAASAQTIDPQIISLSENEASIINRALLNPRTETRLRVENPPFQPLDVSAHLLMPKNMKVRDGFNIVLELEIGNHYAALSLGDLQRPSLYKPTDAYRSKCYVIEYDKAKGDPTIQNESFTNKKHRILYFDVVTLANGNAAVGAIQFIPQHELAQKGYYDNKVIEDICSGAKELSAWPADYTASAVKIDFFQR